MLGSLGVPELIFIFVLALLIFGPRKLPEIGRTIGKSLAEFRKASNDLRRTINAELIEEELRQSDPRKMVRETLDEVKGVAKGLTDPEVSESDTDPETPEKSPTEASTTGGDGAVTAAAGDEVVGAPEIRRPEGQMARGEWLPAKEPDDGAAPTPTGSLAPDSSKA